MKTVVILSAIFTTDTALLKFGALCSGNPGNSRRSCDRYGCGKYGARRSNNRTHKGLDIICSDGTTVYAPFDATLNGHSRPYGNGNKIDDGIGLSGQGLCVKLFYVKPDKITGRVKKGNKIGILLPMQKVYPGITSHVHVQMCDRSDPTKYF
ncbi:leukocyte cell-derived chemotaxin-2 [Amia ocellicauda]|uniref:leukocyte cell-derived chemotaxin-2 n=1 Tax=Amia ocellicauda TaxID=2972642 RepID=UPI0034644E04